MMNVAIGDAVIILTSSSKQFRWTESRFLKFLKASVYPMLVKGRRDAHNAEVVQCALFATCNPLKSHTARKLLSQFSNIRAVPSKLCTDSRLTAVENRLASNLRV